MGKKSLNQIKESGSIISKSKDNAVANELTATLQVSDYPKLVLSTPNETSPKIKTYTVNNSYFAPKWMSRRSGSRTYSIQDLVTIETSHYCSPDWRSHWDSIDKINLFPKEEDIPEEYDNSTSDQYGSGQYDYLSYDKENKKTFSYSTGNQLASQDHYFWVSPDSDVLFSWIETVQECNGWYFHHIIIDNKSDYKNVDKKSIQETINALFDQKREKEKLAEYREKSGDIWIELPWTHYSSWWYEPRVYIWDKHGTPAHEHSNERWITDKILVKFWNPWDYINFYHWWAWYSISINEEKRIDLDIKTSHRRNNQQQWRYDEMYSSNIQPWQIFINGVDVYEDTMSRISEKQRDSREKRGNKFTELKTKLIDEFKFTESEFQNFCKYAWKWKTLSFLSAVNSMMKDWNIKKEEIIDAMLDIKKEEMMNEMEFRNYVLIKKKAKRFKESDVKRVVDKWYARNYLADNLPWIWFVWYFDDAIWALKLALEKWLFKKWDFVYSTETPKPEISDLGQKLLDAWITPNR